jgi:hypothetical protein
LHDFFYILRERLNEPEMTFYFIGSDMLENRPVNIVKITGADNVPVTVYFDQSSKLPTRQVYKRRNEEYKDFDTEVTLFAKYRNAGGGVQWPLDVRRDQNNQKMYEMYCDSVEINKGLRDELFHLPANIKILPKLK